MSENEYEPARVKCTGQSRLRRGICACLSPEGSRSREDTDRDSEDSEGGASVERCAHNPILRPSAAIGSIA
jgi:hypothetical protein